MITDIEDYFEKGCGRCPRFDTPECSARRWRQGLEDLRRICRDAGTRETVKWAHPCYTHAGRNIAIIGAFQGDFRLSFFDAALMTDPHGVLERQGENTRHPDMIRFRHVGQVNEMEPIIRSYLNEAMAYAADGLKAPKDSSQPDSPVELAEALGADPELAAAWEALTPGRRKSYIINLNGAKKSETRTVRILKFRDKIMSGKGAMER